MSIMDQFKEIPHTRSTKLFNVGPG